MRSMVEGACDATMPLPPHFVRSPSPLSAFALCASADFKPAEAREASVGGSRGGMWNKRCPIPFTIPSPTQE
jgi:hypothetical protein